MTLIRRIESDSWHSNEELPFARAAGQGIFASLGTLLRLLRRSRWPPLYCRQET